MDSQEVTAPDEVDGFKPKLSVASVIKDFESRGFKLRFPSQIQSHPRGNSQDSDTSSANSCSDTIQSSLEAEAEEVDLSGLMETLVDDSDEEDFIESVDKLSVRDMVHDCLEKTPSERTEDNIEILLEFTQHLRAFSNMTLFVRRALCRVMELHILEDPNMIVKRDGEELDLWSVIIDGEVEVDRGNGEIQLLQLGDSFGISPTPEKLYQKGTMRTKVADCQFISVKQADYYKIIHQGEENTSHHKEDGKVVLVTEQVTARDSNIQSHIVVKGTLEKLTRKLVEDTSSDPSYVDDFLLTHRIFIDSPLIICDKLLEWFSEGALRNRVTEIVILWVKNHFTDFEADPLMMDFLVKFQSKLEEANMQNHSENLSRTCASKARSRTVTLTRPSRADDLEFAIIGGEERKSGIFIEKVEKKAEEVGLKVGDEILEVNRLTFERISLTKASEMLKGSTHLSFTVKSNLLGLKNLQKTLDNGFHIQRKRSKKKRSDTFRSPSNSIVSTECNTLDSSNTESHFNSSNKRRKDRKGFKTWGPHSSRLISGILKITQTMGISETDEEVQNGPLQSPRMASHHNHCRSNPDLSSDCFETSADDFREHTLRIYKADQAFKYLSVHKKMTAREVVMLALRDFGITDSSSDYSLFEVTVAEGGFIKQKKMFDQCQDLAERIGVASRYYLKNNKSTEPLVLTADEVAAELKPVQLRLLSATQVATQLTLEDFEVFRQIDSTEYVDTIFSRKSKRDNSELTRFEELNNNEMFWVVTEICSEANIGRRTQVIKKLIKIALKCKECRNFYSVFAIISGLNHSASRRLKETWERVPVKSQRSLDDLQEVMDPSRNFSKYRNLINNENAHPPIIPFFPIVNKDLTFIHDGNDTFVDGLVNFQKMRMVAKEVRSLRRMCSAKYDFFSKATVATDAGKRRKKSTVVQPSKKLFEEEQMVRRVKAYLVQIKEKVIKDEAKLLQMSMELEPPSGSVSSSTMTVSSPGSVSSIGNESQSKLSFTGFMLASNFVPITPVQMRKHHPSSNSYGLKSNQAEARFGAATPQSRRKMLALSEPVRMMQTQCSPMMSGLIHGTSSQALHVSPSATPDVQRRGLDRQPRNHERSHSDTPNLSVDFGAASASLSNLSLKKDISGSVTSNDVGSLSSFGSTLKLGLALGIGLGIGGDDLGYCTQPDSHSNSFADGISMKSKDASPLVLNSTPLRPLNADEPVSEGMLKPVISLAASLINSVKVMPSFVPGGIMVLPRDIPPKAKRLSRHYSHEEAYPKDRREDDDDEV